jgi:hypothetical protein
LSGHLFQGRYKAIHVEADKAESFRRVSDYIHLNPARARLLKSGAPKLEQYPWSSYGWFTGSRSLPAWLIRSRVFESHDLPDAKLHNRRRYAGILSEQVADVIDPGKAETNAADFAPLRRGWYVGGDSFRDRLLDRADRAVQGSKRSSFHADGMRRHDEKEAERRLEQALTLLGVRLSDLWRSKQTNAVKQAVAWYVKHGSTVGDEWLCTRLEMGNRTNVHRAVRRFREAQDPTAKAIKRKLRLCAD